MRTEQQLTEAFRSLADESRPPEVAYGRIMARIRPARSRRRRRWVLVAAAAAIAVVAAVTLPGVLTNRTAVPADTRGAGNWNLVHRIDLWPGWQVFDRQVSAQSESTSVGPVGDDNSVCWVTVFAVGQPDPADGATQTSAVEVNGHAGVAVVVRDQSLVVWSYSGEARAVTGCFSDPDRSLELARRVVFEPAPVALPYRLTELPAGYAVAAVSQSWNQPTGYLPAPATEVELNPIGQDTGRPSVNIQTNPGVFPDDPSAPGIERTTINGHAAVIDGSIQAVCLNVREHQVCVSIVDQQKSGQDKGAWGAGERQQAISVAEDLVLVDDFETTNDWPDANDALPR